MEWYYILLIIGVVVSLGMLAIYWFLISRKIIAGIPLVSGIIDPLIFRENNVVFTYKTRDNRKTTELKIGKHVRRMLEEEASLTDEYYEKDDHFEIDMTKSRIVYDKKTGEYSASKIGWRFVEDDGTTVNDYLGGPVISKTVSIEGNLKKDSIHEFSDPDTFDR